MKDRYDEYGNDMPSALGEEITNRKAPLPDDIGEIAPPLPEPACTYADHSYPAFSKRQMLDYAQACRAALERLAGERDETTRAKDWYANQLSERQKFWADQCDLREKALKKQEARAEAAEADLESLKRLSKDNVDAGIAAVARAEAAEARLRGIQEAYHCCEIDVDMAKMANERLGSLLRLSEPPFCAHCGGSCKCDDWSRD